MILQVGVIRIKKTLGSAAKASILRCLEESLIKRDASCCIYFLFRVWQHLKE